MNARTVASRGWARVLRGAASLAEPPDEAVRQQFREEFIRFEKMSGGEPRFPLRWEDCMPCLTDRTAATDFDRHYIYHPAWAARVLAETRPASHVDISSILSFAATVSAFVPVRFYDYRPARVELTGLEAGAADLTRLPFADESILSLSSMHVVEHIGLGRYGDPLDPVGDVKAMQELSRVLTPGGSLLFVVPVGRPRIVFNAHRIYAYRQIVEHFPGLELRQFALVPDDPAAGGLIENAPEALADAQTYGCGCFWFVKS
jgi:SAM-dependent methyltransferase